MRRHTLLRQQAGWGWSNMGLKWDEGLCTEVESSLVKACALEHGLVPHRNA